jgi:hypothetical protein
MSVKLIGNVSDKDMKSRMNSTAAIRKNKLNKKTNAMMLRERHTPMYNMLKGVKAK